MSGPARAQRRDPHDERGGQEREPDPERVVTQHELEVERAIMSTPAQRAHSAFQRVWSVEGVWVVMPAETFPAARLIAAGTARRARKAGAASSRPPSPARTASWQPRR